MSYDPSVEADPDLDPGEPVEYDPSDPAAEDCGPGYDAAAGPSACTYTEYEYGAIPDAADLPATGEGAEGLEADVWAALYSVDDPEMPVSVVDLGLIYSVQVEGADGDAGNAEAAGDDPSEDGDGAHVTVDMTLTYSGCPAREMLMGEIEDSVAAVEGVSEATLRLVWSPEWSLEMVTEQGKERLREFGLSVE